MKMGAHHIKPGELLYGNGCDKWHDCFSCNVDMFDCAWRMRGAMPDSGYLPDYVRRFMGLRNGEHKTTVETGQALS
jgi:hypothetical protein